MQVSERAVLLAILCRQMYRATSCDTVWQVLLDGARSVAAADMAVIYQLDPEADLLQRFVDRGTTVFPDYITVPNYLLHDLRLLRQPIRFVPGQQSTPLALAFTSAIWPDRPPREVVILPLIEQGRLEAVCVCGWLSPVSDEETSALQFLVDDATYARAMLVSTDRRQSDQGVISDAITNLTLLYTHTFDQLIEAALDQLVVIGEAAAGALYLYDDEAQSLHLQSVKVNALATAFAPTLRQLWQNDLGRHCQVLAESLLESSNEVVYLVADPSSSHEIAPLHTFFCEHAIDGILSLAIVAGGWQAGVVQLVPWPGNGFSERQWQWLRSLVRQIGVAIEHSRLFERLRAELDHVQAVVETTNDGIVLINARRRVVIVNRRACYFFGVAEHDLKGRPYDDLLQVFNRVFAHPARLGLWLGQLLGSETERANEEFQVVWPQVRRLQCFSAPVVDRREQYLGRILIFRDVTREREVEQMKNEFVSMVSHELRTPLASTQGALQLLLGDNERGKSGLIRDMSSVERDLLQRALTNTNRLLRLVNDILDIAKIERGQLQLQRRPVAPEEICRNAIDDLASFARQQQVTISLDVPPNLPLVDVDRDRIVQVLVNLLSNAIKFSPAGQQVVVSVAHEQGIVRFSVRDWGPGISRTDQLKLFQKFQQLDQSKSNVRGGSGLGLAISRQLVELHGGRIWVDSDVGFGSTFSFTVPLAAVQRIASADQRPLILIGSDGHPLLDVLHARLMATPDWEVVITPIADLQTTLPARQPAVTVLLHPVNAEEVIGRLRTLALYQLTSIIIVSDESAVKLPKDVVIFPGTVSVDQLVAEIRCQTTRYKPLIMVVDDDPNVRPVLTRLIQRHGMRALAASDGEEALAIVQHVRPQAILLDLRMPGLGGFEVLRRLQADQATASIPVVVLTANDLAPDAPSQAFALGARGFLEKPVSAERLIATLTSVIPADEGSHE